MAREEVLSGDASVCTSVILQQHFAGDAGFDSFLEVVEGNFDLQQAGGGVDDRRDEGDGSFKGDGLGSGFDLELDGAAYFEFVAYFGIDIGDEETSFRIDDPNERLVSLARFALFDGQLHDHTFERRGDAPFLELLFGEFEFDGGDVKLGDSFIHFLAADGERLLFEECAGAIEVAFFKIHGELATFDLELFETFIEFDRNIARFEAIAFFERAFPDDSSEGGAEGDVVDGLSDPVDPEAILSLYGEG